MNIFVFEKLLKLNKLHFLTESSEVPVSVAVSVNPLFAAT